MTKTRTYHHGELKSALIEAGLAELEERGLEQLSLRSIAARVGVSHTAPKNHFDGLRGLLTAIAAEGFRRHTAAMRHGVEGMPRGKARLQAAGDGYLRFALAHPALFKLMFSRALCDTADPDLQEAAHGSHAVLRDIADGLVWDKAATPEGQRRTELMLWSMVHGYAMLAIEGMVGVGADGMPVLGMGDVMPDFAYRPDVEGSAPQDAETG